MGFSAEGRVAAPAQMGNHRFTFTHNPSCHPHVRPYSDAHHKTISPPLLSAFIAVDVAVVDIRASPEGTTTAAREDRERSDDRFVVHVRHAKYRLVRDGLILTFAPMTTSTIGRLFELLMGPAVHSDAEMAQLLGVDLKVLQTRLVDLRKRGILRVPSEDGQTKSWFPTLQATTQALERSGLRATNSLSTRRLWWNDMWANG